MPSELTSAWDECLNTASAQQLAHEWIAARKAAEEWDRTSPFETLLQWMHSDPEAAFLALLAIIRAIEDDETMYFFSAGPLEDFLGLHGGAFIDRIHAIAVRERRLRVFLGGVWEFPPKDVWRRIEALAERPTRHGKWDSGLTNR